MEKMREKNINVPGGAIAMCFDDWSTCDEGLNTHNDNQPIENFFDKVRIVLGIDVVVKVPIHSDPVLWINRINHGVILQLSGTATYCYGNTEFQVRPGDIFYFPKNRKYTVKYVCDADEQSKFQCVCVNFQIVDDIFCKPQLFHMECSSKMDVLFNQLNIAWLQGGNSFQCMNLLYEILSRLYDVHNTPYASPQKRKRFMVIRKYVEEHFTEPDISITSISTALGLSPAYIRKLFSEFAQMSPTQYITSLRINFAKALLKEGTMTVSQVSNMVGYMDSGHFSKKFKEMTKLNPKDYRNSDRKGY